MKKIFKQVLKYYLKFWTKIAILVHRPTVIVVAGSINKSFFRDDIKKTLENRGKTVRSNPKNFNTEIGLPLAILSLKSGYNFYLQWLPVIVQAPLQIFNKFPEYLVLEFGISDKGDMKYLLSIVKPKITVITDINQKYIEGFYNMNELVGEYTYLMHNTKKDGLIVLNYDNSRLREIAKKTKNKIETFSITHKSDWQVIENNKSNGGHNIKVKHKQEIKDYKIDRHGDHHVYSFLASLIIEKNILK